jgi:hypothetical protein
MKKIFLYSVIFLIFLFNILPAQAASENQANIYFFWQEGCPHCAAEKIFLANLVQENEAIQLMDFGISGNVDNRNLLIKIGQVLETDVSSIPFTIIGNNVFVGYLSDDVHGAAMKEAALYCLDNPCPDIMQFLSDDTGAETLTGEQVVPDKITLPFLGEVEVKNFSLPVLTIVFGALDGFNPCAMWVLLFLISLLLGMKDKKRMWILGSVFIVASAFVYFLFMAAWLNLILFLGVVFWVRLLIGLIALGGGGYSLKEFFTNKAGTCKVTRGTKRRVIFDKLKTITQSKSFYLALVGIIILAMAVNLVELICSAGLPAVYTQILVLTNLTTLQYYLYIALYIFIFMLDDLLIFIIAMLTLQVTGMTTKYSHISRLVGGILMVIIGLLLIFKPELLMFG